MFVLILIMYPLTYCFWCVSRRRPHSFFSVHYRLDQLMVFDQTYIDTLLGGGTS